MSVAGTLLVLIFFALLFINVPIAVCIGIATLAAMLASMPFEPAVTTIAQRMAGGINSFTLVAIPLFVLSGYLMGRGGIARRLIDFAKALVGAMPGGLALVNILSTTLFGSISGSAVAAASAMGSVMVPAMEKEGYDRNFSAALTVTSSTAGLLIPPSNILIIYAMASGSVSVAALFIAGYIPGIILSLSLMLVAVYYAKKNNYPRGQRLPLKETLVCFANAIPSLLLIVVVIGGIVGGVFTATEASAVAVLYAYILSVWIYREINLKELPEILVKTAETTAIVLFIIAASTAMSWLLSYENIPQTISQGLLSLTDNPYIILLIITLVLLVVGAFMDMTPAVLIFTPIFLPVAVQLGISPLHFGILMVFNLCIGICTPPVGSVLFVGCSIAQTRIVDLVKPLLPLYLAMIFTLLLVTFIPALSEWLPSLLNL